MGGLLEVMTIMIRSVSWFIAEPPFPAWTSANDAAWRARGQVTAIRKVLPGVYKGMRFDFTPVLLAIVLVFVVVASAQFLRDLPGGEHGLLLFEKACPIHRAS